MKPTIIVPKAPNNKPEFLNAIGIAKMPAPNELFNKCANEPIVLYEETIRIKHHQNGNKKYNSTEEMVLSQQINTKNKAN